MKKMSTITIKKKEMEENTIEKSLTTKGEQALTDKKKVDIIPILKTATGIVFYTATFIVSVAIGYVFIFSVFNGI